MTAAWSCALKALHAYGFAVLDDLLATDVLDAMQAEAAAALEQAEAQVLAAGCNGAGDVARHTGCVLQVLPELQPQHPARSSSQYWQLRSQWPCQQAVANWLRQPGPLLELLQAALESPSVLLYNEQYIIKPPELPEGASTFPWHYDSQYAARTGRPVQDSKYLSLWVALDDMTTDNGCLMVLPGARGGQSCCCCISQGEFADKQCLHVASAQDCLTQLQQQQRQQWQGCGGSRSRSQTLCGSPCEDCRQHHLPPVKLLIPAGTAVFFWADLWHCSGPNTSSHTRTAYMGQFSSDTLRWQDTGELIGMAVPLSDC